MHIIAIYIIAAISVHFRYSHAQCVIEPNIVNNMLTSELSGWTLCYEQPYSHGTLSADLSSCYGSSNHWVFVGARVNAAASSVYVGAYAPSSVLTTTTSSTSTAYKPTSIHGYDVYWYNYAGGSFGFAPISTVFVGPSQADTYDTDSDLRLSWHIQGAGGWRAGSNTGLNSDSTWRKVIYIKECSDPVTLSPTSSPTAAPTGSPTFNASNCEDLGYIKHINWNNLVNEGGDEIPNINYDIAVSSQDMTLTIEVELDYLGYSYINNIYGFGTRYHLGFYSFDSDSIISNCDNRMTSSFIGVSWPDQWRYSEYPYHNDTDSGYYLAYPPSEYWTSSMDSIDSCSRIEYSAVFTWQDLRECKSDDGISSAVTVDIDDQFINMSGKFFVDVVSPVSMDADILYRSYELLSYPFTISVEKSTFTENNVNNIFTFTSSVLDVGKSNDQEDVLEIILLTEAIDQISLSNPVLLASPDYDDSRFTIKNNASDCLTINSDLCAQIWEITVNVECPFTFDGDFAFQFTANCESGSAQCLNYTATYGSVVSLTAGLTFDDYICSDNLFEISYNSSMVIYEDETFTSQLPANAIALIDDRIYVEVSVNNFNVDSNGYAVLDAKLLNVWLCTSDTGLALDQDDLVNSGCFSSTIDPDGPYRIIINSEPAIEGTRNINDTLNNVVRFSFIIPSTITRDTLFIQTQVSMEFTEDRRRRRLLQSQSGGATQMVYESGSIQVMDRPTSTEVISENIVTDDKEEEKESDNGYFHMFFAATSIAMTMVIFM